jgi:protein involved in polysaccharide export with SLBB domain
MLALLVTGLGLISWPYRILADDSPLKPGPKPQLQRTNIQESGTNVIEASASTMEALNSDHRLAIGDQVSFRIVEDEDSSTRLVVTDSGYLDIPYVGHFPAAGRTCREVADDLKIPFEKDYYYRATILLAVETRTKNRGTIYLSGAVRTPGAIELRVEEVLTVSKAILRGGGFTPFADKRHIRVTRTKAGQDFGETLVVDVSRLFAAGKPGEDPQLEAGDLVYVPERMFRY